MRKLLKQSARRDREARMQTRGCACEPECWTRAARDRALVHGPAARVRTA